MANTEKYLYRNEYPKNELQGIQFLKEDAANVAKTGANLWSAIRKATSGREISAHGFDKKDVILAGDPDLDSIVSRGDDKTKSGFQVYFEETAARIDAMPTATRYALYFDLRRKLVRVVRSMTETIDELKADSIALADDIKTRSDDFRKRVKYLNILT